ncbi:MAG: TPM domain-containing protein [Clostridia bacterium]|nr:TPM domain-containing protein [Clostridia bacterium]
MNKHIKIIPVCVLFIFLFIPFCTALAENINSLPDWYPENIASFQDFHAENPPRVVDNANLLTAEEEKALSSKAQELADKYNVGFVIFTDDSSHGLSKEMYASDFFIFNGYGTGDDYSGVILFLCMEPGNRGWRTLAFGKCEKIYDNEKLINELDDAVEPDIVGGNYNEAFDAYIGYTDYILKHKKMPVSSGTKAKCGGLGLISGLVLAAFKTSSQKKSMNIKPEMAAASYFINDSLNISDKSANFLYSSLTKTPRATETRSSGGGSSFGGGVSSSGHTFSGGGRDF